MVWIFLLESRESIFMHLFFTEFLVSLYMQYGVICVPLKLKMSE